MRKEPIQLKKIGISEIKLLPFWDGINITNLFSQVSKIDKKEYWQFYPTLFLNDDLKEEQAVEYNNLLLSEIGKREKIDLSMLMNKKDLLLSTISKKPIVGLSDRLCYTIRTTISEKSENFQCIYNFFNTQIGINEKVFLPIFSVACRIMKYNSFTTYPLLNIGFCKLSPDKFYGQIVITNNNNRTFGKWHKVTKELALRNTDLILKSLDIKLEDIDINNVISNLYKYNLSLCFYGFDVSFQGIDKIKLYFKFSKYVIYDDFCKKISKIFKNVKLYSWEQIFEATMNKKRKVDIKNNYIDYYALSFRKDRFKNWRLNGMQFYFAA